MQAAALARLGIRSVADLILHLPSRYERDFGECTIAEASIHVSPEHGSSAMLAVRGEIQTASSRPGRRPRFEATLFDGTGTMQVLWYNAPWMRRRVHPGLHIRAWGRSRRHGDVLQLVNPLWEAIDPASPPPRKEERLSPVYPATEELSSRDLERLIALVLAPALALIDDHLPAAFREERGLPPLAEAYRMVHRPGDEEESARGRRRLCFDELLMLQLGVMLKRSHRHTALRAILLRYTPAIDQHIRARFPFELTPSQTVVVEEITADLRGQIPMNRLLQGDVGSGKTVVALYAMLVAIADGHQAALMAPTELLAEQHFSTVSAMLRGSRVEMALITGSLKPPVREERQRRIEEGAIDLVVGTHALLTEAVRFHSLAVAVVDEQHRFGVFQRATLRAKSNDPKLVPHTLVMTATPIPRTLSLTVFGDLDVSVIKELPPGRTPVVTRVVSEEKRDEVYAYVAARIKAGEQAYIVVPVIDESDRGLTDVNSHHDRLRQKHLREARLAVMHGRLSREEREAIMNRFRNGVIDVLIATTVIEVGVDVANATVMVIEHAERFGLAQLHQLRGRVGRGSKSSLCVLIGDPGTEDGAARLEAIASTNDGFEIAERDLEIRGPGELFGTKQSGIAPFRVARLPDDMALLRAARDDAKAWIKRDRSLSAEENQLLRRRLFKQYGETLGLGDVG